MLQRGIGFQNAQSIFFIGQALCGHVQEAKNSIFDRNFQSVESFQCAVEAVSFYKNQILDARRAVDEWTKVGMRFKVVKDVRKLIGQLVWEARTQAEYPPKWN